MKSTIFRKEYYHSLAEKMDVEKRMLIDLRCVRDKNGEATKGW